ncbi:MAG TPA: ABC transporter permease [Rectinemataceae bacterium]|nr:ABC transporter permease [Rectinemataceae bacterium]
MNWANTAGTVAGNAIAAMTPLVFAATGGLFTELTGTLNIALEGLILIGAFFGIVVASAAQSLFAGILAGSAAAAILAWAYGSATIRLKANIFVTGLAANIFASGLTVVLSHQWFGTKSVVAFNVPELAKPLAASLGGIPFFGPFLFSHNVLVYLSWFFVAIAYVVIYRTPAGMKIRATGANAEAVAASGFKPDAYRLLAIVLSGFFCGMAGVSLSLPLAAYVPNMSAGRGWIALVAIYLGARSPGRIALACFIFALAESYSNYAQGLFSVPTDFILMIPYAATLVALVAGSFAERARKAKR